MTPPDTFDALALPAELLAGLRRKGFRQPTAVQSLVIPVADNGKDLIVQAQTGSGKTLAFGLPLLARELVDEKAPSALVVSPTRELAKQIRQELVSVTGTWPRRIVVAAGGESLDKQVEQLKKGAHVVVGTPGRLVELLERGVLNLKQVRTLVLDEADEILAKGFEAELSKLIARMTTRRQTMLFSATMPAAVQRLCDEVLDKPQRLKVATEAPTPEAIDHFVIEAEDDARIDTLEAWLKQERPFMAMIFCRTRTETEWVSGELEKRGFENEYLSGELSQAKRTRILERFRTGDLPILVATDLAARGIDVAGVSHVVNYTVPSTVESYVHRTGRTGRAGRTGIAVTLAAAFERRKLQDIGKLVKLKAWRGLRVEGLPRTKRAEKVGPPQSRKPAAKGAATTGAQAKRAAGPARPKGPAKGKPKPKR